MQLAQRFVHEVRQTLGLKNAADGRLEAAQAQYEAASEAQIVTRSALDAAMAQDKRLRAELAANREQFRNLVAARLLDGGTGDQKAERKLGQEITAQESALEVLGVRLRYTRDADRAADARRMMAHSAVNDATIRAEAADLQAQRLGEQGIRLPPTTFIVGESGRIEP